MSSLAGVDIMNKAAESLNYSLRRIVKDKGVSPNDETLLKWVIAGKNNIPYYPACQVWSIHSGFFQ